MRFLCDVMLGGLAKWLRAAGYDAYYAREGTDVSDGVLVRMAIEEGRVLLTSDRGFWSASRSGMRRYRSSWCRTFPWRTNFASWLGASTSPGFPPAAWSATGSWRTCGRTPSSRGFRQG